MNPLVSEKKDNPPILIVDRTGTIGEALAEAIGDDAQIVFVSEKSLKNEKIIFIPFEKRYPKIPDSNYSHIFIVDDTDPLTSEFLPSFQKKASDDKSTLIIVVGIKNQKLITEEILEYSRTKVIFLGDIVDKNIYKSYVGKVINQAKIRGKMELPGEGMDLVFPVFFQDVVTGILEASFGTSRDKVYFLFPRHAVSILSFAHLVQKANPELLIDFGKQESIEKTDINFDGKYLLNDSYPLEEKIRGMKLGVSRLKNDYSEESKLHFEKEKDTKGLKGIIFFLLLFLFLPLISTLVFSLFGQVFLGAGKAAIKAFDLDLAGKYISTSQYFFGLSSKTSEILSKETFEFQLSKNLRDYSEENYKYTQGLMDFFRAADYYEKGNVNLASTSVKNFLLFAQRQKAENKKLDFLSEDLLALASGTIDTWPEILGFEGKKRYLILFPNKATLRPTGGTVEAFAILTLNNGKIENFEVGDPRLLESSLRGNVEPPFAIRRFTGKKEFLLKDSSFNVDFRDAAQDASYLYALETEEKPDAVISLNTNFVKKLLALTGPVSVNGKTVDQRNILKLSEEGSRDFLTLILKEMINSFKKKNSSLGSLLFNLNQDTKNKDLLIAFSKKNIQDTFTVNQLSNALWDERLDSPKVINDTTGISEANLGEPNIQIERKLNQKVDLSSDGKIQGTASVQFKNSGKTDYKIFLRFIIPTQSIITGLKIDKEEKDFVAAIDNPAIYEARNFKAPNEIEISTENKEKVLAGLFVEIPKQNTKEIEITYLLPEKPQAFASDFKYSFVFIKQPGIDFFPFEFQLSFPKEFRILSFPKGVESSESKVSFTDNLTQDYKLELDFSKK